MYPQREAPRLIIKAVTIGVQMAGLLLPWFGPGVGLFVISPLIEMGLVESRQLTVDTQCLKAGVNLCDSTSTFEYFFWNITNPDQVRRRQRRRR